MIIHNDNEYENEIDIQEIFDSLSEKHRNIFWYKIGNDVFICRSLGRIEFKNLVKDERWTDYDKEEIISEACTLYPKDYDFGNCDAGVPTNLAKVIIKRSGLENIETRKNIMDYYRREMSDIDHQITCMINEAFPQHDIEDIETWDIEQTSKYLSRAEWKLANLRGMNINYDPFESEEEEQEEEEQEVHTEEIGVEDDSEQPSKKTLKGDKKEKMTPDKLAQLEAQFPDINWRSDEVSTKGIDALTDHIDSTAPALRPGG